MIRFLTFVLAIVIIVVGVYVYYNSQHTFEAKFKNIDGLPKGAEVTALGVKVGEVIRTKPTNDGVIVTVRIKNKKIQVAPGSQLTITSFRPNQGRILEIIPPETELPETKAWIIQEPITTDTWLHASINLLDGLKAFSSAVIKHFTPENFEAARIAFDNASESLSNTVSKLQQHEGSLINIKERFTDRADEAAILLSKLQKPIQSLNKIITDKELTTSFRSELDELTKNLNKISQNITSQNFQANLSNFKTNILDHLNKINSNLTNLDQMISDPTLIQKIKDFNEHLTNLNVFYEELNKQDIQKIAKESINKAKTATTKANEFSNKLLEKTKRN